MTNPHKYCQDLVAASGSNFYYSFLFLPKSKRESVQAIYAFCRAVDDVVDDSKDPHVAGQKLNWWAEEIERLYHGTPQHPITQALFAVQKHCHLPKVCFEEILQGMAMDLRYQGYQTVEDLRVYCHCVAGAVGVLVATALGHNHHNTLEYAKKLGIGLQIINIIRDIGEDARRGRIYFPEDDLKAFGIKPADILNRQLDQPDRLIALLKKYADIARSYYHAALAELPADDRPAQRSGLIMAAIYFKILEEIEHSNFNVLDQKITITPVRKLWTAWRTWRSEQKACQT
jgi:phytoene synthase